MILLRPPAQLLSPMASLLLLLLPLLPLLLLAFVRHPSGLLFVRLSLSIYISIYPCLSLSIYISIYLFLPFSPALYAPNPFPHTREMVLPPLPPNSESWVMLSNLYPLLRPPPRVSRPRPSNSRPRGRSRPQPATSLPAAPGSSSGGGSGPPGALDGPHAHHVQPHRTDGGSDNRKGRSEARANGG